MMPLKILTISSIIGVLGVVITCTEAHPIEVIYTGDSCDCPKKINYLVNMPLPPKSKDDIPSEYDYKLECPVHARGKVSYRYDLTAEKPQIPLPPPEKKWKLYAKIDRITAPLADCIEVPEVPKTCGCHQSAICNRYVSPRSKKNLRHPNSIDSMASPPNHSHITAIIFTPLKQIKRNSAKSRNRRDLSSIFMRPRKNPKRSDRLVKRYNKSLKDILNEKTSYEDALMPIGIRAITARTPNSMRPLQQLSNLLKLPRLRNKRDIKGEYNLIEKERAQMDLTLPEIIQYMPETLDPNFKRNQCPFGKNCQQSEGTENEKTTTTTTSTTTSTPSTTTTISTTTSASEKPIIITTTESKKSSESNESIEVKANKNTIENKEEKKMTINKKKTQNAVHTKRNANNYNDGCHLNIGSYNPIPNSNFAFQSVTNFEPLAKPFDPTSSLYSLNPLVPQQYLGAPYNTYSARSFEEAPELGTAYPQQTSNAELDRIIAEIVSKHRDFIEASSHRGGALVDPTEVQEEQNKEYLKSLFTTPWNGWFGGTHHHQQQQQSTVYSHVPPATHLPRYYGYQ